MLLEFSCANHKSIKDEVVFSAVAGNDTAHDENLLTVGAGGLRVLRAAVIYGPNGSGKSNLLDAMACLRRFVADDVPVAQTPHKLAAALPSRYCIQFLAGDVRYVYGLDLLGGEVAEEYLYYFPHGRQVKIFSREGMTLTAGERFRGELDAWKTVLFADRPLLACAVARQRDEIASAARFFGETLIPYRLGDRMQEDDEFLAHAIAILRAKPAVRTAVCTMLDRLGTGIIDIRFVGEEVQTVYRCFSTDLRREESTGIRRLIGFLCPLIDMLRDGRVLLCDELEVNLHETVVQSLLKALCCRRGDSRAQLIFSTHNTGLLDLDLFRRDQIWFTELRPADRSTDLYSLAEIRHVRKDENIRRGYMTGKYGGIPLLGADPALFLFETEGGEQDG